MTFGEASFEQGESLAAIAGGGVRKAHFDITLGYRIVVAQVQETAARMREYWLAKALAPPGSPYDDDLDGMLRRRPT